jgi:pseudouridine kinase
VPVPSIACAGAAAIDRHGVLHAPLIRGTSNPGSVLTDCGGVARNVAINLSNLGCRVLLCSRVGDDGGGRDVLAQPIDISLITVSDRLPTATYIAILEPEGELVVGLDDMEIFDEMTPDILAPALPRLRETDLWFVETNLPSATIAFLLRSAGTIPVAVDAVSVVKSQRLMGLLPEIPYLFSNVAQAAAITGASCDDPEAAADALRRAGSRCGIVSAGARGIAVYDRATIQSMAALPATPRDVTGAGDALIAGVLYGLSRGLDLFAGARFGLAAAAITVECATSTAPQLSPEALHARA